jgi:hypothetical protein
MTLTERRHSDCQKRLNSAAVPAKSESRGVSLIKMLFSILSFETPENFSARKFLMDVARAGVGAP